MGQINNIEVHNDLHEDKNNRVYEQVVVPNYQKLNEQMIIEEKVK